MLTNLVGGNPPGSSGSERGSSALRIDLRNRTALVTGSAGELGRTIARTLADCGADMILHYFTQHERALQLKKEVEARGVHAICVQADITSADEVARMQKEASNGIGPPDIVVTNAVIQYGWTTILEQPIEDYESQFRSCVLQNVLIAKSFLPSMIARRKGRIIALNTECSMQNHSTQSAYVSGKRGMDGLLRVLAREIGEYNITVNQVAPGWMISDNDRSAGTQQQAFYEANVPLKRRGEDQDVANVIAFLASDLAGFITGAYVSVSGGNVMPTI
jgi:3-oxoacyl-[acyl-carrier protein] reductase